MDNDDADVLALYFSKVVLVMGELSEFLIRITQILILVMTML